jgi:hypothetical protein
MGRSFSIAVDQSGKAEKLNQDTCLAYSSIEGDKSFNSCVRIFSDYKKDIWEKQNREFEGKSDFGYKLFAAGLYVLTNREIGNIREIIIDQEWSGKHHLINSYLRNFYKDYYCNGLSEFPKVNTDIVHDVAPGDPPRCHTIANQVFNKEREPDINPDDNFLKALVLPSK